MRGRSAPIARSAGLALVVVVAIGAGCAGAPLVQARFDAAPLARLAPALPAASLARLSESTPHLHVDAGGVTFFLCRWSLAAPLSVSLPADAEEDERALLRRGLAAWESALPGLAFREVAAGAHAAIEISFGAAGTFDAPGLSGATRADCRLRPRAPSSTQVLDAELARARIVLARRTPRDWRDRDRALAPAERLGTLLHELGHALGLAGHVSGGGSVLTRTREDVARAGARVLAGGALQESALSALYALPSGAIVRRAAISPARAEPFLALASAAGGRDLAGPFTRVGDELARTFFVDHDGTEAGIDVPEVAALARDPSRIVALPDAHARALVAGP